MSPSQKASRVKLVSMHRAQDGSVTASQPASHNVDKDSMVWTTRGPRALPGKNWILTWGDDGLWTRAVALLRYRYLTKWMFDVLLSDVGSGSLLGHLSLIV